MTTGRLAFQGGTLSETWEGIRKLEPESALKISKAGNRAPQGIDKLLERCLSKKPEARFQRFSEILPLLETMAASKQNSEVKPAFFAGNRGRIARIAGIALVVAAAVAVAFFWWRARPDQDSVIGKRPTQITKNSGFDSNPVFSSDGTQLAYASDRNSEGYRNIWIQAAGGGEPRQLTTGPNDDYEPAFAPDGQTIAFRSDRNGGGIYLVSTKGGEARLLVGEGNRPRYSPDGRWIAYWTGPSIFSAKPDTAYQMCIVPSGGGAPRRIRPDIAPASYPTWSPDGKNLLFIGRDEIHSVEGSTEWFVTGVEGRELHDTGVCRTIHVATDMSDSQCGIPGDWKGNHVYFSVPMVGGANIWRVDIAPGSLAISGKPSRVTSGEANETEPVASGTGRVAFTRQSYNVSIWGVPVDANEGKVTGKLKRWIGEPGISFSPSMTADGARLSFQSNRTGHWSSWLLDMKSGKQAELANVPGDEMWPVISPDGTKVAYSEKRLTGVEQYYRPAGGGQAELICQDCGFRVSGWSRDGKAVLIDSLPKGSRHLATALVEIAGNRKTIVLEDPQYDLNQASFSPDQRSIVFAARVDGSLSIVCRAVPRDRAIAAEGMGRAHRWNRVGHSAPVVSGREARLLCVHAGWTPMRLGTAAGFGGQAGGPAFRSVAFPHVARVGPTAAYQHHGSVCGARSNAGQPGRPDGKYLERHGAGVSRFNLW